MRGCIINREKTQSQSAVWSIVGPISLSVYSLVSGNLDTSAAQPQAFSPSPERVSSSQPMRRPSIATCSHKASCSCSSVSPQKRGVDSHGVLVLKRKRVASAQSKDDTTHSPLSPDCDTSDKIARRIMPNSEESNCRVTGIVCHPSLTTKETAQVHFPPDTTTTGRLEALYMRSNSASSSSRILEEISASMEPPLTPSIPEAELINKGVTSGNNIFHGKIVSPILSLSKDREAPEGVRELRPFEMRPETLSTYLCKRTYEAIALINDELQVIDPSMAFAYSRERIKSFWETMCSLRNEISILDFNSASENELKVSRSARFFLSEIITFLSLGGEEDRVIGNFPELRRSDLSQEDIYCLVMEASIFLRLLSRDQLKAITSDTKTLWRLYLKYSGITFSNGDAYIEAEKSFTDNRIAPLLVAALFCDGGESKCFESSCLTRLCSLLSSQRLDEKERVIMRYIHYHLGKNRELKKKRNSDLS